MAKNKKDFLVSVFEVVTFGPGVAGTLVAVGVVFSQCWKWWETGKWQMASLAGFVPQRVVEWAVAKEGSLLGLKKLVQVLLSIHASVWFFVAGWACTFLLYEMAKPWLKE